MCTIKMSWLCKDKKSSTNAYGRKGCERKRPYTNACGRERNNRPQMPVAKKERPNHKCWWQTKNSCPNQSSKQLTPDERNKTAETTSKPQTVAYLQAASIRWKKNTVTKKKKNPPNHNSLIDYCLQQRSGQLQLEEHRAKITVPTTNKWKAKLTITNSKLTPH